MRKSELEKLDSPRGSQPVQWLGEESWDEPAGRWNTAPAGWTAPGGWTAPADWTAPPPRIARSSRRFRPLLVGGLLLALVLAAGGVAYGLTRQGAGTTMRVSFVLTDDATASAGCVGQGDDAAFRTGDPVTLGASGGRRLAVAALDAGRPENGRCSFSADFKDFRTTYDAYTISLAGGPTRTVKRAELRADGWRVHLDGGPPTRQLNGSLTLYDPTTYQNDCVASGVYSGLDNSPRVVVEDKAGRVIASGTVAPVTTGRLTQTAAKLRDDAWSFVLQVWP